MDHVAAPGAGLAPGVEDRHGLDAVGCGALDVLIELSKLVANTLHVVNELRELAGQLQVAAVADAVNGLAENGPASGDPVLLGLPDGVAPLMEGVGEEIGQEPALGVLDAGDITDETEGGAVAHGAYHGVQADGLELLHVGLGADPVVAQEHHGFLAQLVGDVHHFLGQLGHLPALEGHEVLELLGGHPVLVVIVTLVDDELRTELVAHFLLKLLQNVGRDRGGVTIPVHVLLPLELIKHQGELVEEGGVADDVHIGVLSDELPQPLHGELVGLGLTDVKGDLVFKVLPIVGNSVVHMDRVPDEVGQEAHGVVVESLRRVNDHAAALSVVAPGIGSEGLTGGTVHDLPPALDVIPGIHLHKLGADALHQRNGQSAASSGVEPSHDVALLDFVGVSFCPGVVLAGGIVGGVHLGIHTLEFLRVVGAVAVPDGVGAPAL